MIIALERRARAEVAAARKEDSGFFARQLPDIIDDSDADPDDMIDVSLQHRRDGEIVHRRADDDAVGRLQFSDQLVGYLDRGSALRRMLLGRRERAADPRQINKR